MKPTSRMIVAGLASVLLANTATSTELSGTPEELRAFLQADTRTVVLSDRATEIGYSDIAKIRLAISTEARDLAAAIESNNSLRQSIAAELVAAGISEDDIHSSKYSASPQFGWFGDRPNSFEVVNSLEVTVKEQAQFQLVAEITDRNDDVRFTTAKFEHSEKEAYEQKVRDKVLEAILENQAYFEERLGLQLTPISFGFSDVYSSEGNFGAIEEIVVTSNRASSLAARAPAPAPTFDEVTYSVSVSVTFAIGVAE